MGFTKRFITAICIAAATVFPAGLSGGRTGAVIAFVLVNLILICLYIADYIATPSAGKITVSRTLEEKLSLNGNHEAVITVRNSSDKGVTVTVCDCVPEHFGYSGAEGDIFVPAHGEEEFRYKMKPLKRGEFVFERIDFRIRGLYGFCTKRGKNGNSEAYRVYPNMKDLSRYGLNSLSRSMFTEGIKPVRVYTDSGEFESLRDYAEGDTMRMINWSATARRGSPVVNTFTPEKNQFIYTMIDSGRVMKTPYNGIKMLDYTINASFLLADYCIRGGDNIGMMAFDSEIRRFIKPGKGPAQFNLISGELYNLEDNELSADYSKAFSFLASQQKRRALVIVFTQLFNVGEAKRFAKAVKDTLGGHMVCAITVNDPIAEKMSLESSDPYIRSAAVKFERDRDAIKAVLDSAGIINVCAAPDRLSLAAVCSYLNIKRSGTL